MVVLKGKFKGWCVDEAQGKLWDSEGNDYDANEIRALFYFRQWQNEFEGRNGRIRSLKEHLEQKIKDIEAPTVTINWGSTEEQIVHPKYR